MSLSRRRSQQKKRSSLKLTSQKTMLTKTAAALLLKNQQAVENLDALAAIQTSSKIERLIAFAETRLPEVADGISNAYHKHQKDMSFILADKALNGRMSKVKAFTDTVNIQQHPTSKTQAIQKTTALTSLRPLRLLFGHA